MGEMILAAGKTTSGGSSYLFLFVIVAVLALMYFVTIRPQRRRQQTVLQTQRAIRPGQRVRTTSGMYATISAVDGDDIILEVAPGVDVHFMRRAIMEVLPDGGTGAAGPDAAGQYEEPGEYPPDEYAAGDDAGNTGGGAIGEDGSATAQGTPGETETTGEAGTAPTSTGPNPDGGRPAGR